VLLLREVAEELDLELPQLPDGAVGRQEAGGAQAERPEDVDDLRLPPPEVREEERPAEVVVGEAPDGPELPCERDSEERRVAEDDAELLVEPPRVLEVEEAKPLEIREPPVEVEDGGGHAPARELPPDERGAEAARTVVALEEVGEAAHGRLVEEVLLSLAVLLHGGPEDRLPRAGPIA